MQRIINEQVDELLQDGRIEPSRSPHSAPLVLVRKKTGDMRMCVDYRQLNAHSIPDAYPLPRITHILERLRNARFISTLDLKNGYWQIPMAKDSRECTAFTCKFFQRRLVYLGHLISKEGIRTDPDKIAAIRGLRPPTNTLGNCACLENNVKEYVTSCLPCQQYKVSQCKPAGKMLTRQPTEPFALVGADFVGPLPRTRRGNTMLLVFIDLFFK
ncbi:hypothetical protein KR084_009339, partial [Drosophila pseudotakahashii]